MQMLWLIVRREVVSNVLTSRFIIGLLVCLLATGVAVLVQVDDYEKRLTAYHTAVRESQGDARTWDIYANINPKAHRKPNPLSIFHVGMETFGGNMVSVEPAGPIWSGPHEGFFSPIQKRGADNPFLSIFLSVDVTFIFKIVLSALAILFAYNAISGEREDGTLRLVLSNAVPRDTIVLGKYLGGMGSLLPIVTVSLLFALLFAPHRRRPLMATTWRTSGSSSLSRCYMSQRGICSGCCFLSGRRKRPRRSSCPCLSG